MSDNIESGWIATYTGHKYYPLNPRPEDVCIEDIAHALSNVCRYGGHTSKFYSVAEHSVLVTRAVMEMDPGNKIHALQALLHDAAEAYLCDVPAPVKHNIIGYAEAERKNEWAIGMAINLIIAQTWQIKECDEKIRYDEALELMSHGVLRVGTGNGNSGIVELETVDNWHLRWAPGLGVRIRGLNPLDAEQEFLDAFYQLNG